MRKLVDEHELDPTAIAGTGRDGRLTKADVLAHLESAAKPAAAAPKSGAKLCVLWPAGSAADPDSQSHRGSDSTKLPVCLRLPIRNA